MLKLPHLSELQWEVQTPGSASTIDPSNKRPLGGNNEAHNIFSRAKHPVTYSPGAGSRIQTVGRPAARWPAAAFSHHPQLVHTVICRENTQQGVHSDERQIHRRCPSGQILTQQFLLQIHEQPSFNSPTQNELQLRVTQRPSLSGKR